MTVEGLLASPGPDGVSLREAVEATNTDRGAYTVGFASSLAGKTITVLSHDGQRPYRGPLLLIGGGVSIDGDVNGDDQPDVTLRPELAGRGTSAFQVLSSGNRLHALTLEGFRVGVLVQPQRRSAGEGIPSNLTFADNALSELVIHGPDTFGSAGIVLDSFNTQECYPPNPPCATSNRWVNTAITGNTIDMPRGEFGINVGLSVSVGDRIDGLTITDNTIRFGSLGVGITVGQGVTATRTRVTDVLISRNSIEGVNSSGIVVASGMQRANANAVEDVQVLDNRIRVTRTGSLPCCSAIELVAGADTWNPNLKLRPVDYPDDNVIRNVQVARNVVSGSLDDAVSVRAGVGGASRNRIEDLRVADNVIRSTMMGKGVYLWVGQMLPFEGTYAAGNRITGVRIDSNRITTGKRNPVSGETDHRTAGGIVLLGGWQYARRGVIRNVGITRNRITTPHRGIRLIGGLESTARGNRVSCIRLAGNRITAKQDAVSVQSNVGGCWQGPRCKHPQRASGNRASLGGC